MELTKEQLGYVQHEMRRCRRIDEILKSEFPEALICIARGYDNFSSEAYTSAAFFSMEEAMSVVAEKVPNGSNRNISDSFQVIAGTPEDIEMGRVVDSRTRRGMDAVDVAMIYNSLTRLLQ